MMTRGAWGVENHLVTRLDTHLPNANVYCAWSVWRLTQFPKSDHDDSKHEEWGATDESLFAYDNLSPYVDETTSWHLEISMIPDQHVS